MSVLVEKIEVWPTIRIKPYKRNSRKHSPKQIDQIAESIRRFGFVNPILCSADGEVIAGHGRLAAAQRIGLAKVPVIVVDHLTPDERRALVIADNRIAELAEWDQDLLKEELADLSEHLDLDFLGFDSELPALPNESGNVATSRSHEEDEPTEHLDASKPANPGVLYPVVASLTKPVFEKLRKIARRMNMSPSECASNMISAECDAQEEP